MTGRTILVSGSSSGLGQAIAVTLSEMGAKIIVHGRDETRIDQTLSLLAGVGHVGAPFDLMNYDNLPEWIVELVKRVGPLHGVVHAAGLLSVRPLKVLSRRTLGPMMDVNVNAGIALARALRSPANRADGSNIVFLSSVMGMAGATGQIAYSATKGALQSLTRSMAIELANEGIRANCVAPGTIKTWETFEYRGAFPAEQLQILEGKHPLGFGEPADVAYAVAYLLSPVTGRWITGSTLTVDGGYTAA